MRRYGLIFLVVISFSCADHTKTVVIIPEEEKIKAKLDSTMDEFNELRDEFKERIRKTDSINKEMRKNE